MNGFDDKYVQCKLLEDKYVDVLAKQNFCGMSFGDGWAGIVESCLKAVAADRQMCMNAYVAQIKEKFGTLRFYAFGISNITHEIIRRAEEASAITCEFTGKEGVIHYGSGWLKTLNREFAKEIGYAENWRAYTR